jgi:hypothetical protein
MSSLLLRITYGYHAKETDDHLVQVVEDAMQGFGRASEPGAFWVDKLVFLLPNYVMTLIQLQLPHS